MERRLVIIGDGKIFENRGEYYVQGPANLSIFHVFQGISEIVFWSRIYTIPDEEVGKYSKYDFSTLKVPVRVMGIYNQKAGLKGYLSSFWERKKSLDLVFDRPCLVYSAMLSVTQWMMFLLYRKRNILFISRTIGDHEFISQAKYWYAKIGAKVAVKLSNAYYKKCILQTWVSTILESKYRVENVPSVVFHDCQISKSNIKVSPKLRKEKEFHIIFIGRLSPEKGIMNLLEAIKELNRPEIRLRIVGEGREKENIEKWIKDHAMESVVNLRGLKAWGEELFSEIEWAHCLAIPSYNEGLGMVCVEAMSCGIPVIGSNVGGIPEIVKDGHNGLLVEAGNIKQLEEGILTLCTKEEYRLELSHNALKTAMENTYEGQNEKFREAYMKYVYPKL